jgi:hypothetical protein
MHGSVTCSGGGEGKGDASGGGDGVKGGGGWAGGGGDGCGEPTGTGGGGCCKGSRPHCPNNKSEHLSLRVTPVDKVTSSS